ncbi:transposase [Kitasatospora sp. NPDC059646]|uniref:transposase n=1 Tax=Kitasatospora sp. NPDC059646 TaxID=3346893 RepID=UPI00367BB87C
MIVTPGQRADCTRFVPVLEKIRVPRIGSGRPRKKPESVAADRAYSNGPCREYLRRRGSRHTIPEEADSQAARLRKGSRGGRPSGFDEDRYKKRFTVERAINRLENSRAVTTRYGKGAVTSSSAPSPRLPSPSGFEPDRVPRGLGHCGARGQHQVRCREEVFKADDAAVGAIVPFGQESRHNHGRRPPHPAPLMIGRTELRRSCTRS